MKFNRMIRNATATAMSLGLGLGTIACSRDYTADYVYVTSTGGTVPGTVSAYAVDFQSGVLTQIAGSPFQTNLTNPGSIVATPSGKFVYVIGGTQNPAVEELAVGSDGKLYGENTYSLASNGSYPTSAAIDQTGSFLYVTYTYAATYGPNHLGPGGVSIYKINSDGSLAAPTNQIVGNNPVGVSVATPTCTTTPAVTPAGGPNCATTGSSTMNGYLNVFVYVVDAEGLTGAAPTANSTILSYSANIIETSSGVTGTGALTPTAQTVFNTSLNTYQGITVGVSPSAVAIDPTGRFLYVTDKAINEIIGFQIDYTHTGNLATIVNSPFSTGLYPVSVTIEPRGKYIYVANYNSNTVSSYSINSATGALGGTAAVGNFTTATGPTCVTVDPALGIYIYTSNYLDGSVSAGKLSPNTGQLDAVVNTPFPTSTLPSCVTSVANGSHAIQIVNP